jgi:hypothetical protein
MVIWYIGGYCVERRKESYVQCGSAGASLNNEPGESEVGEGMVSGGRMVPGTGTGMARDMAFKAIRALKMNEMRALKIQCDGALKIQCDGALMSLNVMRVLNLQ